MKQDREREQQGQQARQRQEQERQERDRQLAKRHPEPIRPVYTLPEGHTLPKPGIKPEPLRPDASRSVVAQVNAARQNGHGINARPLPPGKVFVHQDGALRVEATGGRHYSLRPDGSLANFRSQKANATFSHGGRIVSYNGGGMRITRNPGFHHGEGGRTVFVERPDRVVMSAGPHFGYVQRPMVVRNTRYVQRTYVANDTVYTRAYVPYAYHGVVVYQYAPAYYYTPTYYQWAGDPWVEPVTYRWSWASDPWYGYYGSYFVPQTYYYAPWNWLADYLLSESLREAYLARANEPEPAYYDDYVDGETTPVSPLTEDVREAIALEVRRQMDEERAAAAAYARSPSAPVAVTPSALQQAGRIFVVSTTLDVLADEQSCSLSAGDVLRLEAVPPAGEVVATVRVLSSKGGDCIAGSEAVLSVNDLQEMYNSFHEKLDSGMGQLRSRQGTGGIPTLPSEAMATMPGPGAAVAAPADNAAALITEAQHNADRAEAELEREVAEGAEGD